jgi:hypothetical protein
MNETHFSAMKIFLVSVAIIALSISFLVSPFIGMSHLRTAIDTRNAAELSERVDFRRVGNSLSEQIVGTYLKITGRSQQIGVLGTSLAAGVGRSLAEPLLAEIVNPEGMLNFLTGTGVSVLPTGLASFSLGTATAWQLFLATEYGFGNAYVTLPLNADTAEQFRVRLQILQWNWKVTAIELPERVRIELAKELQKRIH